LPDACAGAEVDNVSKNVLEDFEQIDKSPPKCVQNRDPQDEGPKPEASLRRSIDHPIQLCKLQLAGAHV
jgi:hypothetical protein